MPILTPEERVGKLIAERYRLDSILGVGGMGVVFAGTHTWTGRRVAVKILAPEYVRNERIVQRFLQEARAAARMRHPNVVDVLDMGEDEDGTVFLVLELLEGESMHQLLMRDVRISPQRTLELLVPVMQALVYAHRRGIVHRDIKPDNIFISVDDTGAQVPKLLDFGIAKVIEASKSGTVTGTVIGTPYYMSPEQAAGSADTGPPADVWSMGVVLYECLSGNLPFTGANPTAVLLAIACGSPIPLAQCAPELPTALASAIDRALAPDRTVRYASMKEFIEQLARACEECSLGVEVKVKIQSKPPSIIPEGLIQDPRRRADESSRAIRLDTPTPAEVLPSGSTKVTRTDPNAATMGAEHHAAPALNTGEDGLPSSGPPRPVIYAAAVAVAVMIAGAIAFAFSGDDSERAAAQPPSTVQEMRPAVASPPPSPARETAVEAHAEPVVEATPPLEPVAATPPPIEPPAAATAPTRPRSGTGTTKAPRNPRRGGSGVLREW